MTGKIQLKQEKGGSGIDFELITISHHSFLSISIEEAADLYTLSKSFRC